MDFGVIFDMDGVLVDSYRAHFLSWRQMVRAVGLDMTEQQFAETFGRTTREIIGLLWPGEPALADVAAADDAKEAAYREILRSDFPAMDGAPELLRALHAAGFSLAVGSSGPPENVALVLELLEGAECITAAVTARDVTRGKPDPEVFLKAAEKLKLSADCCAVVEDAPAGIEAARRAGMAAIGLTGTAGRETLAPRAHLVVDSLRELTVERIAGLIRAAAQ